MTDNKDQSAPAASPRGTRYAIIALAAVLLFAVSYGIASARSADSPATRISGTASNDSAGSSSAAPGTTPASGSSAAPACACCGGGSGSAEPITGTATLENGVQRIDVDLSTGSYDPNTIVLKAGVPAEITFGESGGCTAQVMSEQLGFFEDLTSGPKTVKLAALEPGEYEFSCGMQMVFGKVVVQ